MYWDYKILGEMTNYMDEIKTPIPTPIPPRPHKKVLQVPVIKGWGEKQELVVKLSKIAPPSPPVFRIIDVDKKVFITNTKLIILGKDEDDEDDGDVIVNNVGNDGGYVPPTTWTWGKVIIDGYIDKNVIYKTITDTTEHDVNGPVFQFTTRANFATFVEVKSKEPLRKGDKVEILKAFVEGEKEELLDPNPVAPGAPEWAVTYNKLLEKMIVKIKLKVTRTEHVPVAPYYPIG